MGTILLIVFKFSTSSRHQILSLFFPPNSRVVLVPHYLACASIQIEWLVVTFSGLKPPSLLVFTPVFSHTISLFLFVIHLGIHLGINIIKFVINFVLCMSIGSSTEHHQWCSTIASSTKPGQKPDKPLQNEYTLHYKSVLSL